ncbi:MAG: type I-E CRISPR-associated protein Cas7/Cse4/CasC [Synergistales bacterium]|nr:type I-E CRISPR-associated protein Cas7/Cse4/CasC [Synergistales bacterium]
MSITPRFIQISTLTSYPSVLLNRDDSGLAKRIPFGGYTRTRVSSQCRKRHIRTVDDFYGLDRIADGYELSVRSRKTFSLRMASVLEEEGFPKEVVTEVLKVFQKKLYEGKDEEKDDKKEKASLDREEVVVLGEPEIRFLIEQAREICRNSDKKTAKSAAETLWKDQQKVFLNLKRGAGIDAALFGRFVSGEAGARIDAAVHVAHSFTVHQETFETDYFTAVDDLVELGSGHINSAELTSGLFYNYAVIDVPQLVSNTGEGLSRKWLEKGADRTLAARISKHLIHLFATVTPGAKLGSTAPYSYADFLLAEMGERQPRSLANAFADPVELGQGELLAKSLNRIERYVSSLDDMYGPHEIRYVACRLDAPFKEKIALHAMADKVEQSIIDGICG